MTIVVALSANEAAWLATLAAGLVVALLVWLLLELLRRRVNEVERAVSDVWTAGKRLAQGTQATHLLGTTRVRAEDVRAELERTRS